jgi:hypothetical protein
LWYDKSKKTQKRNSATAESCVDIHWHRGSDHHYSGISFTIMTQGISSSLIACKTLTDQSIG